ncbi:unnamed protein product (macronuclear) [Paramecium tetraurelia]|uniref:Cache domain-containing protein n=1 Tax=Paramecium tetraurelia TaxID=5888 RepID=A0DA75_PARTE|nr:uncharacterized protein GSPATT00014849001 [Paramecium tetraurelia]CAK79942.1 unnamed protein product [Paramecium tetraurelia]|eukprot:XP_001447339.1 hypothetical protein (macronuclear) [Paramecium tetraurelia strain d4-2]
MCFRNCLRKQKMENQIIFGITAIMLISTIFIGIAFLIQNIVLFKMIQASSSIIFIRQENNSIQNLGQSIKQYFIRKHEQYIYRLNNINKLFQYYSDIELKLKKMDNLESCLYQDDVNDNYIRYSAAQFCYQACGSSDHFTLPQDDQTIEIFNQTTQILNQFTISFPVTLESVLSYADLSDTQFYSAYPLAYSVKGYQPKKRLWYTNHVQQMKLNPKSSFFYSPAFLVVHLKTYAISLTYTLQNSQKESIGIAQQLIQLIDSAIQDLPYNALIINKEGQLVLNAADFEYDSKNINYIYNQSLTGFNQSDWEFMQELSKNKSNLKNCNDFENVYCLYDKLYNSTIILFTTQLKNENFTILLYTNFTMQQQVNEQMDLLQLGLVDVVYRICLEHLASIVIITVVSMLAVRMLFSPLKYLMNSIKNHILQIGNNLNRELFKMLHISKKKKVNTFSKLTFEILKFQDILNTVKTHRNPICYQIEKFQYKFKNEGERNMNLFFDEIFFSKIDQQNELNEKKLYLLCKQLIHEQYNYQNHYN